MNELILLRSSGPTLNIESIRMRKAEVVWLLALIALGLGWCGAAEPNPNPAGPPHVLVIIADQFRFDCMGASGNRQVRTPHLDGLAAEGIRFNNCFCAFPVCTP